MMVSRARASLVTALSLAIAAMAASLSFVPSHAQAPKSDVPRAQTPKTAAPQWIWASGAAKANETVYLRKNLEIPDATIGITLVAACDNAMELFIDGKLVAGGDDWGEPVFKDVTGAFTGGPRNRIVPGRHVLAAKCVNQDGPAGLVMRLMTETRRGPGISVVSDTSWKASDKEVAGWKDAGFDDAAWAPAVFVQPLGGGPWAAVNEDAFTSAARKAAPTATPGDRFKVAKGFKVELLYTVPKDQQGSWVNMTVDPKGRLIVSDQYGKLYRVTPPTLGASASLLKVEPITAPIGEAQGLLWAFDSLYVVVNRGRNFPSGLYRVRDKDHDDQLESVEMLRELNGAGEHGPHAVVLSPDGESLYVVAGNATRLTELSGSRVPRIYDEDQILPYLLDGNGFMRDERAPGGCVYQVDPSGKNWVLVSMGYRNPFDLAFNRNGDLFTYDSDMEWDMNTPWYRPTRVCQADSGSDLGYRNGSGKWPPYYPDSLPPVLNIGPGSPTGVCFGYGAKFPAKYQDAFYICDWSYGKLYAVHMKPKQSSYSAEAEEFVTGTPLPLTDVVVNPLDGAMYFTTGGRMTLSGLYRVTFTGTDSTAPSAGDRTGEEFRKIRRSLEAFHGRQDSSAVDAAWPYLGHDDRFIRYAARVALEFQDPKTWQARALSVTEPEAALTALLAVARTRNKSLQPRLLDALDGLGWHALSLEQKLSLLRVYQLALARMGMPDDATSSRLTAKFDAIYPSKDRELNSELSRMLVALQAPSAASKTMALLAQAPTQEEQLDYAAALRLLKTGWTPEMRKEYFSWFGKAARFRGGSSLVGFLRDMRNDAIKTLSSSEKESLGSLLELPLRVNAPPTETASRPFVKEWKVDDLATKVERGLATRDFEKGRAMFAATSCFTCHRFDNEGGTVGPDLTGVAGRFSPRDLLESIILPSKSVSDQYQAVVIATTDGRVVTGRIVNLNGDNMMVNTNMLDPNLQVQVNRRQIEEIKPSPVSMMPEGLINTLKEDEILDLLAYLLSRGDRKSPMFR
jgi:putative heme-binding domain-containing protein